MADNLTKEKRSKVMSSIRGKNTKPEIVIRKLLWSKGKRYRLHNKSIMGIPDISNKKKKIAVFLDGCFWHGCNVCYVEPRTNVEYWRNKMVKNKKRRKFVINSLDADNWKVLEFWEHEINFDPNKVATLIAKYM